MGLNLNDYMTGADAVAASAGFDIPDGFYDFEVSDIRMQNGTKADENQNILFIDYALNNGQKKSDLFYMPKDPGAPSQDDTRTIARYKSRLIDLGVPRDEVNTFDTDAVVGRTGTFELSSVTKNGKTYQNIRNLRLGDEPTLGGSEGAQPAEKQQAVATSAANPFAKQG